ncbi:MAG: hypothetical protein A2725_04265 [Candidatus Magasanikbacteria bacterium RIFCSPHIGHO2_01_FULL_33_34]|uniref:Response regulatory domain-containing protein n=1 Tax=Candidatus Magasanikbacteria bacterium RIFCSPHIGHO2_01_FULL_33_34 TaxID=1798671 RepID=A0A1F6LI00_9BACT|nr:MAG: hypothetical protein A2725_04265 [Candidatus Magasanikbacteria bacterium RIFCSPHIGHO2_01_FULL_33_34]OGH65180.1 MAG: hypothetical protein A3B83_04025 [Candidatus Magasanikbacteria bacterium RIFCSPHIGHO2_02_FULL_33_17]OGH75275.1 MAG: hypothetical protein A3A89_04140 [Candidatus Magasanikbacteria bacterium RIFCSPLOWO2_01_FULL_33_34]OGH81030.1 MAG: hypothetical protein A3F93_00170 [Candidatus Magasanikbacteria bacterium RIFCSPLOWO2_12_FULL_34_7]
MKEKILIVEDEKTLRNAIKIKLDKIGYKVLEAKNGREGLEIALKEKPDLILLDIVMPIMDGMKMLKRLRKNKGSEHILVIVLTNISDAEKIEESLGSGVCDYLIKSDWKLDELVQKIKERIDANCIINKK